MISKKGLTIKEVIEGYKKVKIQTMPSLKYCYYCDTCNNAVGIKSSIKANPPTLIQCDKSGCKGFMKIGLNLPFLEASKEFYFPDVKEAISLRKKARTIKYLLAGGVLVKDIVKQ